MEFNNLAINPDAEAKAIISKLRRQFQSKASGKVPSSPFNQPRL